jgi:hypothetical protein
MGQFIYEATVKVDFDDRILAHLQLVIGTKLRRGEPLHFTWRDDPSIGDGRTTVWVHPRSALVYKFYGSRKPPLKPGMDRRAGLHGQLANRALCRSGAADARQSRLR